MLGLFTRYLRIFSSYKYFFQQTYLLPVCINWQTKTFAPILFVFFFRVVHTSLTMEQPTYCVANCQRLKILGHLPAVRELGVDVGVVHLDH